MRLQCMQACSRAFLACAVRLRHSPLPRVQRVKLATAPSNSAGFVVSDK